MSAKARARISSIPGCQLQANKYLRTDVMCPLTPGATASQIGMVCTEKIRLQQHYDVAVRRWRQFDAHSQITHLTEELRKRALAERDAAKDRLTTHQQNCKTCRAPQRT